MRGMQDSVKSEASVLVAGVHKGLRGVCVEIIYGSSMRGLKGTSNVGEGGTMRSIDGGELSMESSSYERRDRCTMILGTAVHKVAVISLCGSMPPKL